MTAQDHSNTYTNLLILFKPHPMAGGSNIPVSRGVRSSGKYEGGHSKQLVLRGTTAKSTQPHPSTSRALVLRKAAHGSGELAVGRKVSGQEKLSLLAGE